MIRPIAFDSGRLDNKAQIAQIEAEHRERWRAVEQRSSVQGAPTSRQALWRRIRTVQTSVRHASATRWRSRPIPPLWSPISLYRADFFSKFY